MLKLLLVAAGSTLGAGAAHAQAAPAAPPTGMGVGLSSESAVTRPGGDNSDRDASMRRDEALDKARNRDEGKKRTARTVPATLLVSIYSPTRNGLRTRSMMPAAIFCSVP